MKDTFEYFFIYIDLFIFMQEKTIFFNHESFLEFSLMYVVCSESIWCPFLSTNYVHNVLMKIIIFKEWSFHDCCVKLQVPACVGSARCMLMYPLSAVCFFMYMHHSPEYWTIRCFVFSCVLYFLHAKQDLHHSINSWSRLVIDVHPDPELWKIYSASVIFLS